jgi:imidazole glycerol-phosphate synthase subunit HisH
LRRFVLVEYGAGNIGSLLRGLKEAGHPDVEVVRDPSGVEGSRGIIVPGVGAFASGMGRLRSEGWVEAIRDHAGSGGFVLGICAGMQFLASRGAEGGDTEGLDLIGGTVVPLDSLGCTERLPHVGWSSVETDLHPMFNGIPSSTDFYFSHRYTFVPEDPNVVAGHFTYGVRGAAAVSSGNVHGIQFHPEKSSFAGIRVLSNTMRLAAS